MNTDSMFTGKNAIPADEAMAFATDAGKAATVAIQNDKSQGTANNVVSGRDELARRLINNGVARQATVNVDPCKTGKERWYIETPYVINDTGVGKDDDGTGCCVGTPSFEGCRYKMGIDELCVKDCVATSLDEMMEDEVTIKGIDTTMPIRATGDTLARVRAKILAKYVPFIYERNMMLGTPTFSGNGMRPFNGLISRLVDKRVLTLDGSAGVIPTIMALDCRLRAMGLSANRYLVGVNSVLIPTLQQEVRTYMKTDPFTMWRMENGHIFYGQIAIVESKYVDVDLATNTTSIWLIDPSKVGIKAIRPLENPYIKKRDSEDDCGGHCITMHTAGTTVVTDWSGLVLVKNVALSSICDSLALSGLDDFVNSGSAGFLYPKVTANPGI